MKVTLWGTRGSLASPGPETARYGGNTSCVEVRGSDGTALVLDAGTGIRRLGAALPRGLRRVDVLLTHLHMDHIQGMGFFAPLYDPDMEVHVWGPDSLTSDLRARLMRYLSPPLFPVHLRDLPCRLTFHSVPCGAFQVGEFRISSMMVCHPGPTVGYRIAGPGSTLAYLPDHEPALGARKFPLAPDWTSGYAIAEGADLLLHDTQFSPHEYRDHVGWGHSSMLQAIQFAALAGVRRFVAFHHNPDHTDRDLDRLIGRAVEAAAPAFPVTPGMEGATFDLTPPSARRRRARAA